MSKYYSGLKFINNKTKLNEQNLNKMNNGILKVSEILEALESLFKGKQILLDERYKFLVSDVDIGEGLFELKLKALDNAAGFNVVALESPSKNPTESTIALKCVKEIDYEAGETDADAFCQFVDISCLGPFPGSWDKRGTFEIVLQSRGITKLPPAILAFNNGTAGRVKKLVVYPDATPMEFTADGIKVRKNNNFDNNVTDDDFVLVNLIDMKTKIEKLSAGGAVTEEKPITDFSLYGSDFFVITDEEEEEEVIIPTVLTLKHSWELASSLTDTVGGVVAVSSNCKKESNGINIYYGESNLYMGNVFGLGRRLEVDISSMSKGFDDTVHGRFLMIYEDGTNKSEGLVWRKQTQTWSFYVDGTWSDAISSDPDVFSGKTMKIVSDSNGYLSVYAGDEYVGKSSIKFDSSKTNVCIGGYADSFYSTLVTGVRVYG